MEMILAHPDKPWDWGGISRNPNITMEMILANPDKPSGFLTTIEIPATVTKIGRGAFYGCSSLTTIVIPATVTMIGSYVFYGCSSLTTIGIPATVTMIGDYVFYGCSSLLPPELAAEGAGSKKVAWNLDPLLRFRTPCLDLE